MLKKKTLGPYKGHWLVVLIFAPLLAVALWTLVNAAIAMMGDLKGDAPLVRLFASGVFTAITAGILALAHWIGATHERDEHLKAQFPKEPWKWKPQWHDEEIKSQSKLSLSLMAGLASIFSIASVMVTPKIWDLVFNEEEYIAALFFSFPLISLYAVYLTSKKYRQWKRFKGTAFRMNNLPAAIGHVLKGQLVLTKQPPKGTVFNTRLLHAKITVSSSGGDSRRSEEMLWEDTQDIPAKHGSYSTHFRLPIAFKLPEKAHSSDWSEPRKEYLWTLSVKADLPGPDYEQIFELPIYDPDHYDFHVPNDLNEEGDITGRIYQDMGDWRDTHVQTVRTEEGDAYYCAPARHKGTAIAFTLVAVFTAAISFVIAREAGVIIGSFFGLFLALFTLIFGGLALDLWFHKIWLVVSKGRINLRYGLFARKRMSCTFDEISDVVIKSTMRSGTTAYYDIIAKLKNGRSVKLAIYLEGKRDVTALRDKIADEIGLKKA